MFGPNKRRIASLVVASGMLAGGLAAGSGSAAAASTESSPETGSLVVDAPDPIHFAQAIIADGIIIAMSSLRIIVESSGMMPPGCQGPCPGQG
ncbi:hypothetical protein SAMN05444580_11549 [Rhodococcus tukisamuensis]|uniref:Uncharacterized protein n=1 Tax=Rhodococcus tukisamuensis TaxID=168276 RepID=A0A1G7C9D6_9NOCA|nr:hypothetical protein SAMN05444580_11549 [Rhodococcus tukisamuensis]